MNPTLLSHIVKLHEREYLHIELSGLTSILI
jgi:hypothetical protein